MNAAIVPISIETALVVRMPYNPTYSCSYIDANLSRLSKSHISIEDGKHWKFLLHRTSTNVTIFVHFHLLIVAIRPIRITLTTKKSNLPSDCPSDSIYIARIHYNDQYL